MKLKFILVVLCIGITLQRAHAQNSPLSLKPGKPVPDMTFKIMNNDKGSISLSSLRGKLVILDFWSTGCITCVKKFPYLDSLQALFGDKIKIILVNPSLRDDENDVNRIFAIHKKNHGKTLQLSSTIQDTTAVKYFPHSAQSHFAWIDQQGIVKAITGYVKKEDIEQILAGKTPAMTQKNDFAIDEQNESLLTNPVSKIRFKSMFTGYLHVSRAFRRMHLSYFGSPRLQGARFINEPLFRILCHAHNYFPDKNRILFEGLNRADFICPDDAVSETWSVKNNLCYELIAPGMSNAEAMEQCKADIAAQLRILAAKEERKVRCWVIKMDERQMKKIQQKNKKYKDTPYSLSDFMNYYASNLKMPLIVETQFENKIFPMLSKEDEKYQARKEAELQKFAKDNDLVLLQEDRTIEVFVIKNIADKKI